MKDFENRQQTEEEKETNRQEERGYEFDFGSETPPSPSSQPQEQGQTAPPQGGDFSARRAPQPARQNEKKHKRAWAAVGIALGLIASYFVGYFSYSAGLDSEMRSLIKTKDAIQDLYYDEVTDEQFYNVLFGAINNQLLDPYSAYMNADEFAAFLADAEGIWSGLGISFSTQDEKGNAQLLITRVSGNSPAERAGLTEGTYIVGYGETETQLTYDAKYEDFLAFVDGREADEAFTLAIKKEGVEEKISIAKEAFVENYVFYRTNKTAYRFTGEDALTETEWQNPLTALDDDTAYIRLTLFNGNAAKQFKTAMKRFKEEGKKHLVLDLRENGGGYMDILQEIASYFCKNASSQKPLIAKAKYKDGDVDKFEANGNYYSSYFSADSKIRLLADHNTASASECLIGCMIDYGTLTYADICLSERQGVAKTYGKGIMQSTYPLRFLGKIDAIKLTTAKIFWPISETCIHDRGVLPDDGCFTVKENYQKDAELTAALALFQGQNN